MNVIYLRKKLLLSTLLLLLLLVLLISFNDNDPKTNLDRYRTHLETKQLVLQFSRCCILPPMSSSIPLVSVDHALKCILGLSLCVDVVVLKFKTCIRITHYLAPNLYENALKANDKKQ